MEETQFKGKLLRCPVEVTLKVIGGKYKPILLYLLDEHGVLRFGELRRLVPQASKKMLTQQLRELESDGLLDRKVFHQVPPKVEYSLSRRGKSLEPILTEMGPGEKNTLPFTKTSSLNGERKNRY
jgi:DNA-binding HxlR family transcriptional regulator